MTIWGRLFTRKPQEYPCLCGCGRVFSRHVGWDGYHGA